MLQTTVELSPGYEVSMVMGLAELFTKYFMRHSCTQSVTLSLHGYNSACGFSLKGFFLYIYSLFFLHVLDFIVDVFPLNYLLLYIYIYIYCLHSGTGRSVGTTRNSTESGRSRVQSQVSSLDFKG